MLRFYIYKSQWMQQNMNAIWNAVNTQWICSEHKSFRKINILLVHLHIYFPTTIFGMIFTRFWQFIRTCYSETLYFVKVHKYLIWFQSGLLVDKSKNWIFRVFKNWITIWDRSQNALLRTKNEHFFFCMGMCRFKMSFNKSVYCLPFMVFHGRKENNAAVSFTWHSTPKNNIWEDFNILQAVTSMKSLFKRSTEKERVYLQLLYCRFVRKKSSLLSNCSFEMFWAKPKQLNFMAAVIPGFLVIWLFGLCDFQW